MPEIIAILLVSVVSAALYVGARIHIANPANQNLARDFIQLKQHRLWLEERLQQAWRENWDQTMRARIADEIEIAEAKLARAGNFPEVQS